MSSGFTRANGCDLCRAARITPWYYEDEICWIAECEICEVPMVVWRFHGTTPPDEHVVHMRERLREVATAQFGEFWVDDHMRNIPDHYHAPARWAVLYEVLWRLVHDDRDLLKATRDPTVRRLNALAAQARREAERAEQAEALQLEQQGAGAASFVPIGAGLAELRAAAARCTGCDLYRHATQTVFGRGPADARIVLVGEQPGDQEDLKGAPFVGPAGEVLDRALVEVGLDRERLYVTNAVKHFKFIQRGKRRIHQTPRLSELAACRPWMEAEIAAIKPEVLVCLGATSARAIVAADFRLLRDRGRFFPTRWTEKTIATLHPSAVLRRLRSAGRARLLLT